MRSSLLTLVALSCALPLAAQTAPLRTTLLGKLKGTKVGFAGVWGYTAPDGREYAIVGERTSTWIVDCTTPTAPVEVASFSAPSSTWREITSYKQYMYSCSENHAGIRVIDMSNPAAPVDKGLVHTADWSNTHSISADPDTGRVYANGTGTGQWILNAAADPIALPSLGKNTLAYVHDCYVRRGKGYLAEVNNQRFRIVDVTTIPFGAIALKASPQSLTHNTWVTDDDKLLYVTHETTGGDLYAYDITTPSNPVQLTSYAPTANVCHNIFGIGRTLYLAHYIEGFHVIDGATPATAMTTLATYDTSTAASGYNGAWGAYPWTDSGVCYISDMQNGLYVVQVDCAHLNRYGAPTAGTNGAPRATFDMGCARVNSPNLELRLTGLEANGAYLLVLAAAPGNTPVLGITVHVDLTAPLILSGTADANGKATVPLPVPNNPGLGNAKLYFQIIGVKGTDLIASRGHWFGICP